MRSEVVGSGEVSHADFALEGFLSSVGPHVTGQFVTPAKLPGESAGKSPVTR